MTCCVAALCDDAKTIILVSDRMFSTWSIQSELKVGKFRQLGTHWWILFAGDDISPVFDIIDLTRAAIAQKIAGTKIAEASIPVEAVAEALKESYEKKRLANAEALYLSPIGWNLATFNTCGHSNLPDFQQIKANIADYQLGVEFLVCGFSSGIGYLLTFEPKLNGGIVRRQDAPGFHSIGSGAAGANYMMYYRELSSKTPARKALYYAMEAKLFGEQAGGVGQGTDVYVATADGKLISIDEKQSVEKKWVKVWDKLKPRWIQKESADILNSISELEGFAPIETDEEGKPFQQKTNR